MTGLVELRVEGVLVLLLSLRRNGGFHVPGSQRLAELVITINLVGIQDVEGRDRPPKSGLT